MNDVICLNPDYSTTRLVSRTLPARCEVPDAKFDAMLLLPPGPSRTGEGGLRMQGYFKAGSDSGQTTARQVAAGSTPLITVVTAVFNGEKTLEQTILSVINQSYSNIEYIIIDGGSTDKSLDIIKKYEHAIDYWVSEPDGGIYDAWNKGVRLSAGDWVAFLGSDDEYADNAIQAYVTFIDDHRDNTLEYVSSRVNLTKNSKVLRVVGGRWNWSVLRKYMNLAQVGSMHHRRLFEKYGLFDDSYKISGDYEFLLRPGRTLQADFLDAITVNMQVGGASDANIQVFREVAKAKIYTGNRSILLSHFEKYWAIFKWKIRNYLRS
jgi:glycosyltransferase involved in cell wall biosynthesis